MSMLRKKSKGVPARRQDASTENRVPMQTQDRQHIFSRNRTLTGSTSSYVGDATRQADLQSPRGHIHHLARKRRRIGMVFLTVLLISAGLFALLTQFTAVVTVSVSDATLSKNIDDTVYVKAVNGYLSLHPFSRLRFALDTAALQNYLVNVTPEVADVQSIAFQSIGVTNIVLSMRQPVAVWAIQSKQYFVDANGVAFERNYFANPSVQIVDESGVSLEQGTAVISNSFLSFVGRVVTFSKERNYTVTQAIIPSGTIREVDIVLADTPTHVKLSVDRPAGDQVEDMARALEYLKNHGVTPGYIDVRVSGKAYYK